MTTLEVAVAELVEAERSTRKHRAVRPLEARVQRAAKSMWRRQHKATAAVVARHSREFTPRPLREAADPGDLTAEIAAAIAPAARILEAELARAYPRALAAGAAAVGRDITMRARFDLKDERAIAWLKDRAADRVRGITAETASQMRTILATAADQGWSYQRTAKEISTRFAGFSTAVPQRHLRSRAELVAVTEVGDAYEHGRQLAVDDLTAAGVDVEKSWLAVGDERMCSLCGPNWRKGWIASDKTFPSGHDKPLAHPGCRCDMSIRPAGSK